MGTRSPRTRREPKRRDGDLRVNFLWDDEDDRPRSAAALFDLTRATVTFGGTLSCEHGIGVSKLQYLHLEHGDELIEPQRDGKRAFDPRCLLNPGKIFAAGTRREC